MSSIGFDMAIGVVLAALMGFAMQRGATCTVAAVDDWYTRRSFTRLRSMLETSLWVLAGLLGAHALHLTMLMPKAFHTTAYTFLGAALLGFGAFVNRACVFGAIARFGCGELSYVLTPIGFYLGCVLFRASFSMPPNEVLSESSVLFGYPLLISVAISAWIVIRMGLKMSRALSKDTQTASQQANDNQALHLRHVWTPGSATIVIGISFLCMFLVLGPWAYTDVLADLSAHMENMLGLRGLLLLALFIGALVGGWSAGKLGKANFKLAIALRCAVGGALMGVGSLMVPGSNDGLLLLGLPLLRPYALFALASMCCTILACMTIKGKMQLARKA